MYLGAPWCPLTWIKENCSVFEKEVTTVHSAWVQKKGQTWWCIVPEVSSRRSLLAGARESNLSREWEKKPRLVFVLDLNQTLAIHSDQQPTVLTHLLKAYLFHIYRYFFVIKDTNQNMYSKFTSWHIGWSWIWIQSMLLDRSSFDWSYVTLILSLIGIFLTCY